MLFLVAWTALFGAAALALRLPQPSQTFQTYMRTMHRQQVCLLGLAYLLPLFVFIGSVGTALLLSAPHDFSGLPGKLFTILTRPEGLFSISIVYLMLGLMGHNANTQMNLPPDPNMPKFTDRFKTTTPPIYLLDMMERMCRRAGLPTLSVVVIDQDDMTAMSLLVARPDDCVVIVSRGLLRKMRFDEQEAVIAHELAHVVHNDLKHMPFWFVTGASVVASGILSLFLLMPITLLTQDAILSGVVVTVLVAFFLRNLFRGMASRRAEYAADARARAITGSGYGLAKALVRLERDHMGGSKRRLPRGLFTLMLNPARTHPPIAQRIRVLTKLRP
jgi:Zn-dependent protease with chaperone function